MASETDEFAEGEMAATRRDQEITRAWLRELLDQEGINPTEAARRARVSQTTLTRFLNTPVKHNLSFTTINKLITAFGVEGPQLTADRGSLKNVTATYRSVVKAPLISWAQAGGLVEVVDPATLLDATDQISIDYHRETVFALRVRGNSMDRIAPEGSIIIVDYADRLPVDGRFYVFRRGGECGFKRLVGQEWQPFSNDRSHKSVRAGGTEIIGRVVRSTNEL